MALLSLSFSLSFSFFVFLSVLSLSSFSFLWLSSLSVFFLILQASVQDNKCLGAGMGTLQPAEQVLWAEHPAIAFTDTGPTTMLLG